MLKRILLPLVVAVLASATLPAQSAGITEGGIETTFAFSPLGDRSRMTVKDNGTTVLTRHYLGDRYEFDKRPRKQKPDWYYYATLAYYGSPFSLSLLLFLL